MKIHLNLLLATTVLIGGANAATVMAEYVFTGVSLVSSDTDATTTAGNFTEGSGVGTITTGVDIFEIPHDQTGPASAKSSDFDTTIPTALTNNVYAGFTVTIPFGTTVNITSIDFDYSTERVFWASMGLFSSKTGFSTSGQALFGIANPSAGSEISVSGPVDLSANAAFQNLTDTTVEFRFYFTDDSASSTRFHRLDNVILEGSIIPEPSTALLGGLGLLALLRRRR